MSWLTFPIGKLSNLDKSYRKINLNTNRIQKVDYLVGLISILLISLTFILLSFYANTDLIDGRYSIFMDEQIVFDEVKKILSSSTYIELLNNIVNGDHRYGRIFFYTSALSSAIPADIFGAAGQITSIRLFQTTLLLCAYLIFTFTFFRSWTIRASVLLLLLLMPTTLYYFTMPKPEPLQTLFLALFLWSANKNNFKFGWYWIFMGLAFGAKISVAPYILMFGILAVYQNAPMILTIEFWKTIIKSIFFFFIGFFIAEPILLYGKLEIYLNSTFRNTTHGADEKTITVMSWLDFIYSTVSPVFTVILVFGVLLLLSKTSSGIIKLIKNNPLASNFSLSILTPLSKQNIGYFILLSGIFMLFIIILRVDRLWYFYLHLPFIFILIGTFIVLENYILYKNKVFKSISIIFILTSVLYSSAYLLPNITEKYMAMSKRTEAISFKVKKHEYTYIKSFLNKVALKEKKKLNVYYDPHMFLLDSTKDYKIIRFWGWFHGWENNADIVIFYPKHNGNELNQKIASSNINYVKWVKSKELYNKFVKEDKKYIQMQLEDMPKNLRIFMRSDIYQNNITTKEVN